MYFRTLATLIGLVLASGGHAVLIKSDLLRIETGQSKAAPKCATRTATPSGTHCYLPAVVAPQSSSSTSATPKLNLTPNIANALVVQSSFRDLDAMIQSDLLGIELDQTQDAPKCATGTTTPSGTHCYLPAVVSPQTSSSTSATPRFNLPPNVIKALTLPSTFDDVGTLRRANDALLREPITRAAVAVPEPTTWSLMVILTFGFLLRTLKKGSSTINSLKPMGLTPVRYCSLG